MELYLKGIAAAVGLSMGVTVFGYCLFGSLVNRWWKGLGIALLAALCSSIVVYAYLIDMKHLPIFEPDFWLMVLVCEGFAGLVWLIARCRCLGDYYE